MFLLLAVATGLCLHIGDLDTIVGLESWFVRADTSRNKMKHMHSLQYMAHCMSELMCSQDNRFTDTKKAWYEAEDCYVHSSICRHFLLVGSCHLACYTGKQLTHRQRWAINCVEPDYPSVSSSSIDLLLCRQWSLPILNLAYCLVFGPIQLLQPSICWAWLKQINWLALTYATFCQHVQVQHTSWCSVLIHVGHCWIS